MPGSRAFDPCVRFAEHFAIPTHGCWEWLGGVFKDSGYGKFNAGRVNGRGVTVYAHRFSFEMFIGPIAHGQQVLHRCDNRRCVNPDHLFLGTQRDNMHDMLSKGRARQFGKRSLTQAEVHEIRSVQLTGAYGEITRLAARFQISAGHFRSIRRGDSWRIFSVENTNA